MQEGSSASSDRAHPQEALDAERRAEIEAAIRQVLDDLLSEHERAQRGRRPLDDGSSAPTRDHAQPDPNARRSRNGSWVNQAILVAVLIAGLAAMALVGRAYAVGYIP